MQQDCRSMFLITDDKKESEDEEFCLVLLTSLEKQEKCPKENYHRVIFLWEQFTWENLALGSSPRG